MAVFLFCNKINIDLWVSPPKTFMGERGLSAN